MGTNINIDTREIAHAEWYTRDQLTSKLEAGVLGLPGPSSIAFRMIQTWRDNDAPL
jgi:NAD+ diphosphatase